MIDDVGQDLQAAREVLSLNLPLTFAILPHLPHSREIAREAREKGRELLLHLPMEPRRYPEKNPGPGSLLSGQGPEEVRERTRAALAAIPGITGVNNHMGSRLTVREDVMKIILEEVKAKGLYFIDSYTTAESVAYRVAKGLGLRVRKRTLFLDNEVDEDKIGAQIARLIVEAKRSGVAIGIAHPYPETIAALRNAVSRIRESGVKIVPAGEVVR
ncbi:divergent polysaccharide deacetylase family protein [Nitrospinota bacterium]